jgi:Tol biopolymer transport system component
LLHRPPVEPRTVVRWTYTQKDYFGIPALSHDGSKLVYTEAKAGTPNLALRMMDQVDGKPIPGSEGMFFPDFSPDGQWVAAFIGSADLKLKKIPVSGGTAITLTDTASPYGATWGDDDTIVYSAGKGLMRISGSGGTAQPLTTPDEKKGETMHRNPHFLPGAKAVVFTIATAATSQIAVLDLKKPPYRVVVNNGNDARYAPSGHLLYLRGSTLYATPFDAGSLSVAGAEAPVVEGVSTNGPGGAMAEFAFSDTGLLVYMHGTAVGGKTVMGWVDRQGTVQPLSDPEFWGTGRLSPDAKRVANQIHVTNGKPNAGDIWTWEVERRTRTRLTFEGENADPIWTPDGKGITFGADVGGKVGLYSVPADGSGRPQLLLATDTFPHPSSWSPDGKSLLYSQGSSGKPDRIWMVPVSGGVAGKPAPLHDTATYERDGEVSPDGRWVAYVSRETGQLEIYAQPFPGPGGKIRVSTQGGASVRWARNGRELFYMGSGNDTYLTVVDVQPGAELHLGLPHVLVKTPFGTTWDPAPDGKRFLIEQNLAAEQSGQKMQGVSDWFAELTRRVPGKR